MGLQAAWRQQHITDTHSGKQLVGLKAVLSAGQGAGQTAMNPRSRVLHQAVSGELDCGFSWLCWCVSAHGATPQQGFGAGYLSPPHCCGRDELCYGLQAAAGTHMRATGRGWRKLPQPQP